MWKVIYDVHDVEWQTKTWHTNSIGINSINIMVTERHSPLLLHVSQSLLAEALLFFYESSLVLSTCRGQLVSPSAMNSVPEISRAAVTYYTSIINN